MTTLLSLDDIDTRHKITRWCYEQLVQYYENNRPRTDYIGFFLGYILDYEDLAVRTWGQGQVLQTDFDFRGKSDNRGWRRLWYVPNHQEGITLMLPHESPEQRRPL